MRGAEGNFNKKTFALHIRSLSLCFQPSNDFFMKNRRGLCLTSNEVSCDWEVLLLKRTSLLLLVVMETHLFNQLNTYFIGNLLILDWAYQHTHIYLNCLSEWGHFIDFIALYLQNYFFVCFYLWGRLQRTFWVLHFRILFQILAKCLQHTLLKVNVLYRL